jgi:precorrin-6Y C5,15-methyltransferase (decarboxylating)
VDDVTLVGLHGGAWFGDAAGAALRAADVLIGAVRHLHALPAGVPGERVPLTAPVDAVLELAAERRDAGQSVCVLASGDPGFFGLARLAAARFPVVVHPAPSSVSLAFARAGTNWDDAAVVSAHGRPLSHAVGTVLRHPKAAVLTAPDQPPEAIGRQLLEEGCGPRQVTVCSDLCEPGEAVERGGVAWLAGGAFPARSVVVFLAPAPAADEMGLAWGLPDDRYAHRDGMVTKAEVRAVALGKLALPQAGVLWDVGAGSGSVAVECARLAPALRVFAVERRPEDAARLRTNTAGTGVTVVEGEAPGALRELPDPDRAFVGGGGLDVLDAVLARLRPGGVAVATYAALDRAAAAARRLGNVVQVAVSRGVPVGAGGALRLAAENPVFVCWSA